MERSGFFNANVVNGEYDRVYLASSFAAYFASFIGNGVYAIHSDQLQVVSQASPDMSVRVSSGQAWINGYWYENTEYKTLDIDVADGVMHRIDSIVVSLGAAERDICVKVKKGTPSLNPVAPQPSRSADYYELLLATVRIQAGSTNITQSAITDTRSDSEVCGWVAALVQQFDFTHLFDQFEQYFQEFKDGNQADYENWTDEKKAAWDLWVSTNQQGAEGWIDDFEQRLTQWYTDHTTGWSSDFTEWFEGVRDQLSEDVAGRLFNIVNDHEERISALEYMVVKGRAFAPFEASDQSLVETNEGDVIVFEWQICPCQ